MTAIDEQAEPTKVYVIGYNKARRVVYFSDDTVLPIESFHDTFGAEVEPDVAEFAVFDVDTFDYAFPLCNYPEIILN